MTESRGLNCAFPAGQDAQQRDIRVLDDDTRARALSRENVLPNYEVLAIQDPKAATELAALAGIEAFRPEVVLVVLHMSVLSGIESTAQSRQHRGKRFHPDHFSVGRSRQGRAAGRDRDGWRRVPDETDPAAPPGHRALDPRELARDLNYGIDRGRDVSL